MKPRVLSLFSGIGGIDLAFERAGFEIVGQIEYDKFCNKVLTKHWPHVPRWGDILQVNSNELKNKLGKIDIMVGGFPCQNISIAGKKEGIQIGNQSGLWFEFRRLISDIRPQVVFLENVAAINVRGGVRVIADLTQMGYDCEWGTIRASDTGEPHRRERWFCIAKRSDSNSTGAGLGQLDNNRQRRKSPNLRERKMVRQENRKIVTKRIKASNLMGDTDNTGYSKSRQQYHSDSIGSSDKKGHILRSKAVRSSQLGNPNSKRPQGENGTKLESCNTSRSSHRPRFEPCIRRVLDGLPTRIHGHQWPARLGEEQYEWEAPRIAPKKMPNRRSRIKALGNAVVPQVIEPLAEEIMIRYF